jgi:hypothetical protein
MSQASEVSGLLKDSATYEGRSTLEHLASIVDDLVRLIRNIARTLL